MAGRACGGEFRAHNINFSESEIGLRLCVAGRRIVRHCAAEKHKTTSKFTRVIERQLRRNWYCVPVSQFWALNRMRSPILLADRSANNLLTSNGLTEEFHFDNRRCD